MLGLWTRDDAVQDHIDSRLADAMLGARVPC